MARSSRSSSEPAYGREVAAADPFRRRDPEAAARAAQSDVHVYGDGVVCSTDSRGRSTPAGMSLDELVLDASEGFIPLWAPGVILRWRFQEQSLAGYADPEAAKTAIRQLLGAAVLAWGDAAPVKFAERDDAWDFEVVVREADRCTLAGCVLASAFFPDAGRHELRIYPKLFEQPRDEQVETLVHEIGHVFGLRHFFANISETQWASQIFGEHNSFSIMNYGAQSSLTDTDRADLKRLYELVWNGELEEVNGTRIQLMEPFSANRIV